MLLTITLIRSQCISNTFVEPNNLRAFIHWSWLNTPLCNTSQHTFNYIVLACYYFYYYHYYYNYYYYYYYCCYYYCLGEAGEDEIVTFKLILSKEAIKADCI
jgi:hypothetical protein